MSKVTLSGAVKRYGEIEVIHGIDLDIEQGEFCVFVGPSGCGKSTLLRMIAGLEETTGGSIHIGTRDVTRTAPGKRGVAMVFQTYALYPHMTVRENMAFGLKMSGMSKKVIAEKVAEAARVLRLEEFLDRRPKALSGGQRQRVAIGRAIVRQPDVFLFDEPLSNLDAELRVQMRLEIARLHRDLGATMIYVTHDQVEAMTLADKIVVLRNGVIEQVGTPEQLYSDPVDVFVAQFIGSPKMNLFKAKIVAEPAGGSTVVLTQFDNASFPAPDALLPRQDILVGIRPEAFNSTAQVKICLDVDVVENLGGVSYAYAKVSDVAEPFCIELRDGNRTGRGVLATGFDPASILLFDAITGKRL